MKKVYKPKAVMIGSRNFRFSAELMFNTETINQRISEEYQAKMERIVYIDDYADRENYLNDLVNEVPQKVVDRINFEINNIEHAIKTKYPNCQHIYLEINH